MQRSQISSGIIFRKILFKHVGMWKVVSHADTLLWLTVVSHSRLRLDVIIFYLQIFVLFCHFGPCLVIYWLWHYLLIFGRFWSAFSKKRNFESERVYWNTLFTWSNVEVHLHSYIQKVKESVYRKKEQNGRITTNYGRSVDAGKSVRGDKPDERVEEQSTPFASVDANCIERSRAPDSSDGVGDTAKGNVETVQLTGPGRSGTVERGSY